MKYSRLFTGLLDLWHVAELRGKARCGVPHASPGLTDGPRFVSAARGDGAAHGRPGGAGGSGPVPSAERRPRRRQSQGRCRRAAPLARMESAFGGGRSRP